MTNTKPQNNLSDNLQTIQFHINTFTSYHWHHTSCTTFGGSNYGFTGVPSRFCGLSAVVGEDGMIKTQIISESIADYVKVQNREIGCKTIDRKASKHHYLHFQQRLTSPDRP